MKLEDDCMNKNEFITVTAESGIMEHLNINHIVYYYRWRVTTFIILSTGIEMGVIETCDKIDDMIDEAMSK
jgi:hypothetical protein